MMNSRGRYLSIMSAMLSMGAISAQSYKNGTPDFATAVSRDGTKFPYRGKSKETRNMRSKYMPHDGARKAERERRNYELVRMTKANAIARRKSEAEASRESKGFPVRHIPHLNVSAAHSYDATHVEPSIVIDNLSAAARAFKGI